MLDVATDQTSAEEEESQREAYNAAFLTKAMNRPKPIAMLRCRRVALASRPSLIGQSYIEPRSESDTPLSHRRGPDRPRDMLQRRIAPAGGSPLFVYLGSYQILESPV